MPYIPTEELQRIIKEEVAKQLKQFSKENIKELLKDYSKKDHRHEGQISFPVSFIDLKDGIKTTSSAPSVIPLKKPYEQIVIYKDGSNKVLYIFDFVNSAWIPLYSGTDAIITYSKPGGGSGTLTFKKGSLVSYT